MPRFNLKDEETNPDTGLSDTGQGPNPPTLREVGGGGGRISPIFLVLLILVLLAAGVFALNYFKVINLWGKKAPVVTETLPEPDLPAPEEGTADAGTPAQGEESLPLPSVTPPAPESGTTRSSSQPAVKRDLSVVPTGTGKYTIQFSAWLTRSKAEDQASRLANGGYDAYVDEATDDGQTWYRVRVGRYDSRSQANDVVARLQVMTEDDVWLATQRAR